MPDGLTPRHWSTVQPVGQIRDRAKWAVSRTLASQCIEAGSTGASPEALMN